MEAYANNSLQLEAEQHGAVMGYSKTGGDLLPAPHLLTDGGLLGQRPLGYGFGHGHETAAQRYNATRIQAGFEPERSERKSRGGLGGLVFRTQLELKGNGGFVYSVFCESNAGI